MYWLLANHISEKKQNDWANLFSLLRSKNIYLLKLCTCQLESKQALDKHDIKLISISYTARWKFRKSEAFFFTPRHLNFKDIFPLTFHTVLS